MRREDTFHRLYQDILYSQFCKAAIPSTILRALSGRVRTIQASFPVANEAFQMTKQSSLVTDEINSVSK